MKKFLALTISLVLLLSSVVVSFAEGSGMGDIDGNGRVDVIDATAIQRHIARIVLLDEETFTFSDVDGDGKLSVMDCTSIQQFVAKVIKTFPCEQSAQAKPTESIYVSTDSSLKPSGSQAPTVAPTDPVTQAPTQPPTVSKEQICKDMEQEILRLVNVERKKAKLKTLTFGYDYYECAKLRADECNNVETFSHTRPNGKAWHTVFKELKAPEYIKAGENIALYFETPKQVVDEWMKSEGHRKNILHPDFKVLAVGVEETPDWEGYYCGVQLFVQPKK